MAKKLIERDRYVYPVHIYNVLRRLMKCSGIPKYGQLYNKTVFISILYNQYNNYPITEQVYNLVWEWINDMLDVGCINAIKDYWSQANQYYTFKLNYSFDEIAKQRFREFHVMLASLVLYKNEIKLLDYILTFSNSLPPKYYLIPSTLNSILDVYRDLSKKNETMYLLKYHINGLYNGAGEENKIEGVLIDYLCLLMVRLGSVNDYNITYSEPYSMPLVGDTIEKNLHNIRIVDFFIRKIDSLIENKELLRELGYNDDYSKHIKKVLEDYKGRCNSKIHEIKNNPNISEDKRAYIKSSMLAAVRQTHKDFPLKDIREDSSIDFVSEQKVKLYERVILAGYDQISSNLGDAIVNALYVQARMFYCYQFLLNSPATTYAIPYRDMGKAMKLLCLSKGYDILAMGVSPHFYDETEGFSRNEDGNIMYGDSEVVEIMNNRTCMLILHKEDIPFLATVPLTPDKLVDGEIEIEKNNHLYSNIDSIKTNNPVLSVKMGFHAHIKFPLRYIKINISYSLSSDDILVKRIQPVKKIIG